MRTALDDAVDTFAIEMKKRLRERGEQGARGWDTDPVQEIAQDMQDDAIRVRHAGGDKEVDIANRAMFLWHRKNRTEE